MLLAAVGALLLACTQDHFVAPQVAPRRSGGIEKWSTAASVAGQYDYGLDNVVKHGGKYAAYLTSLSPAPKGFLNFSQQYQATFFRGQRVRWSAWVRQTDLSGAGGALWMRVDGPTQILARDDMSTGERPILGTADWHQVSIVLDVADNAVGFFAGVQLRGGGDLLVDDVKLEVVGPDVPVTDMLTAPIPAGTDSALRVASYASALTVPANLDFEGVAPLSAATTNWLKQNAQVFATAQPGSDLADLEPLRQMVGVATIVGLGEGTHGTREFFQMKHRILEFLVKRMGFTAFAIEGNWPEANDINRYVLTGAGDPRVLLAHLYFWPWETQEVLDLILWMREWNVTAPSNQKVQFLGFDMQFPGTAMDTVAAFLGRVAPADSASVLTRYDCLIPYRNHGRNFDRPASEYAALSSDVRSSCRSAAQEVHDFIRDRRTPFESVSSAATYANALQSARLVLQWESTIATSNFVTQTQLRDQAMADNTLWLFDQLGAGARMVLWAHNGHVARRGTAMGARLSAVKGAAFVNVGFLFGRGSFNALVTLSQVGTFTTTNVPAGSLEEIFVSTQMPRVLFDSRRIPTGDPTAAPLAGPILMREIGATYSPMSEFQLYRFPSYFDLLIYFANTTAATRLPGSG
jgi:erythromycin esterase